MPNAAAKEPAKADPCSVSPEFAVEVVRPAIGDLFAPTTATGVVRIEPKLEKLEAWLLAQPVQAEYELKHSFAPAVYLREILMLKNTLLIGHEHRFEHFNMVLSGRALVLMDGKTQQIVGPCYFKSGPGVRKVLYILEEMRWVTVHPNPGEVRDTDALEDMLIRKSDTFLKFKELMGLEEFRRHAEQFCPRREEICA